jgi:hypothetical protein
MKRFVSALLLCAALVSPAQAVISVTVPASNTVQGSGTAVARTGLTFPTNSIGIIGGMIRKNGAGDTISVADSAGNTWTIATICAAAGAANPMFIAYFNYGGTGLTAGSVTLSASVSMTATAFTAIYATGVKSASPEDGAVYSCNQTASTTSPTITTPAAGFAGDMLVNVTGKNSTSAGFSYTEDTGNGWTNAGGNGNTSIVTNAAYQVNAGSGAVTHNPTMAPSATWTQLIVGFQDAGAPTSSYGGGTTVGVGH